MYRALPGGFCQGRANACSFERRISMRFNCFAAAAVSLAVVFGSFPGVDAAQPIKTDISAMFDDLQGGGTAESPYLVSDANALCRMAERINSGDTAYASAYYRQTAPLVLTEHTPIGSEKFPFCGTYDGSGFPIIFENAPTVADSRYVGLFGYAKQACFSNMVLVGDLCADTAEDLNIGFLCGYYTTEKNGAYRIRNCEVLGQLTAKAKSVLAGGLIGQMRLKNGTLAVSDCYSEIALSANGAQTAFAGGLFGFAHASGSAVLRMSACVANGAVASTVRESYALAYGGGLIGYFYQDDGWIHTASLAGLYEETYSLSGCAFRGTVTAGGGSSRYRGALIGYANGAVTVNKCYSCAAELVPTNSSENGQSVLREDLFDAAFLTENLGLDLTKSWICLADASGLRLISRHKELLRLQSASNSSETLRFQPINVENGLFAAAFYGADGKMTGARSLAFSEAAAFSVTVPKDAEHFRVFLFADCRSLKPLLRKPLSFTV